VRVALISTSPLVLAGLRAGLNELEGVDVVWMGQTLADWQSAGFTGADVAIVDVGADAVAALDALGHCAGSALVLLADDQSTHINSLLEDGFTVLPRNASLEMIAGAAHAVTVGLVATSPQLWSDALRFARLGDCDGALDFEPLTPREKEVVAKMTLGLGNREIAQALQISIHTAKFHVAQIISKLEANSRAHAVAKALKAGLVEQ
jgi:DNA-binding NarL/FixJ family response regulator